MPDQIVYGIPQKKIGTFTYDTSGELLTLDVAPATPWAVGDVITGQSGGKTSTVLYKLTDLTYVVSKVATDAYTLDEVIGVTGVANKLADQGAAFPTTTKTAIPQVITGIGFKPSLIQVIANVPDTLEWSSGYDDGTNSYCICGYGFTTAGKVANTSSSLVRLYQTSPILAKAEVASFDTDGFTLTWVKGGAKVGVATMFYTAFR